MFTGIIEHLGTVSKIEKEGTNYHFIIESNLAKEVKVDQSIAHNGVCLTAVDVQPDMYKVTAVEETMKLTNLGQLSVGDVVNLELAMKLGDRLDGHIVQGHVDTTGRCAKVEKLDGSWYYHFEYDPKYDHLMVNKGSICINGVSLTVINPDKGKFAVTIIPYTYEHTSFKNLKEGDLINLEFDIIGKYMERYAQAYVHKN